MEDPIWCRAVVHHVCLPFTEPGLYTNIRAFLSANTERTARGPCEANCQKVYGMRITDCTFKASSCSTKLIPKQELH